MSTEIQTEEKIAVSLQPPDLYKVIFLNDDRTPMEFVIDILMSIFKHSDSSAKEVTLDVHNTGSGIAGIYAHEIAEQLGIEATKLARTNGFPLQINIERE
jgi:ATP-dependent Clp protease adaptor protein ClpS